MGFPPDMKPVAVLCLGHVEHFYSAPMLALEKWRTPRPLAELVYENHLPDTASGQRRR